MLKRLLFTAVFTLFGFIFYAFAYAILDAAFPGEMIPPEPMNGRYFTKVTILFAIIVLLAYQGAVAIVYPRRRGDD